MADRADSRAGTARLVEGCAACIEQCGDLLRGMPDEIFAGSVGGVSSIGVHVRHIIDRYQCFFDGLGAGRINYDDRRRGTPVETEVATAAGAVADTRRRCDIRHLESRGADIVVRELVHYDGEPASADSTLDRELMGLITHSIHHLAIIALLARNQGYPVPKNLGKAPSTIAAE